MTSDQRLLSLCPNMLHCQFDRADSKTLWAKGRPLIPALTVISGQFLHTSRCVCNQMPDSLFTVNKGSFVSYPSSSSELGAYATKCLLPDDPSYHLTVCLLIFTLPWHGKIILIISLIFQVISFLP